MPEHIRIDYGIVSKKHLILDLEVVTDVSKTILEKSFGDIVTEAEIGELKRIELSKMNLKTENRVNKNAVVVEEVKEIQEVGEDKMSLFKKNKKNETEIEETTSEVENTAADEALNVTDEQSFVHEFVPPADDTTTEVETSTEEVVENTEIKNEEKKKKKMNETTETTQPQQQETAPAPRKRLTTKRVIVGTGIVLGVATLVTTGVVCWKKFHK